MKDSIRQRIIEKARDLLFTRTEEEITMTLVASELGLTAPTLYHYFKGKDELLGAGNVLISAEIVELASLKFPPSIPYEMRIITAVSRIADYFMVSGLPAAYLLEDPADRPVSLVKVRELFALMFAEYKKTLKSVPKISAEQMSLRFLGAVVADLVYLRSNKKELPEDFAEKVWQHVTL